MNVVGLKITLLDPAILSSRSASGARPETLSYLPGSILLGIAARKLYSRGGVFSFGLFHSGNVRFGDALAVTPEGALCLPCPLSLHKEKGCHVNAIGSANVADYACTTRKAYFKQIKGREVALDGDGTFYAPARALSMRTAISSDTGLAADGQLFSYEALDAGQVFWARIDAETRDDLEEIATALVGEHMIGRSKMAEFGRIKIEKTGEAWNLTSSGTSSVGAVRYACLLSDAWFIDSFGLPTNRPGASVFDARKIDWAHSFLRFRSVAPFNAYWGKRAEARGLVCRGSVFVLEQCDLPDGLHWVGLGQERGYGLVWVASDPPGTELLGQVITLAPPEFSEKNKIPDSRYVNWVKQRHDKERSVAEAAARASEDLKVLRSHYQSAKRLAGKSLGPSPNQWSSLESGLASDNDLASILGDAGERDRELWGASFTDQNSIITFRDFVQHIFREEGGRRRLQILAKQVKRAIEQEDWFCLGNIDSAGR